MDEILLEQYSIKNLMNHSSIDLQLFDKNAQKKIPNSSTTIATAIFSSTIAVNGLIKIIHNQKFPHRIIFDLYNLTIENYFIKPREDCKICGFLE